MKKLILNQVKDFLNSLESLRGYSTATVETYSQILQEAFKYIEITKEDNQTIFNLMPYRLFISELNPKTISKKLRQYDLL